MHTKEKIAIRAALDPPVARRPIRCRVGLSVREAAWLLGWSESQARRRLASGQLALAVAPARIDPRSIERLLPQGAHGELARHVLRELLVGRISAPRPASRYARPAPITDLQLTRKDRSYLTPGSFDSITDNVTYR
jgi:hypothetical protein